MFDHTEYQLERFGNAYQAVLGTRVSQIHMFNEKPMVFNHKLDRSYGGVFPMTCMCPNCIKSEDYLVRGEKVFMIIPSDKSTPALIRRKCIIPFIFDHLEHMVANA